MTMLFPLLFLASAVLLTSGIKADEKLPKDMNFQLHSGDLMPLVGFGTYQIRGTDLIKYVLDQALAAGYRLIDSAKVYGNEEDIGKALKELLPKYNLTRKDIWITTKLSPDNQGEKAYEALQESVRKLDCGYVDLYLIHWPGANKVNASNGNNSRLRDESWKQMVKGVKDGLTKNIGVSNYLVRHLKELLANDYGIKPSVNQVEWHPHYHPQDLLDFCRKEGILLQAYSSLGGTDNADLIKDPKVEEIAKKLEKTPAQLTSRGRNNARSDIEILVNLTDLPDAMIITETWLSPGEDEYFNLPGYNAIFVSREKIGGGVGILIKEKYNYTEVLLKWALQQNLAIIPKARSKKHIDENIELNFTIPEEDMITLSNFSKNKYAWDPETIV